MVGTGVILLQAAPDGPVWRHNHRRSWPGGPWRGTPPLGQVGRPLPGSRRDSHDRSIADPARRAGAERRRCTPKRCSYAAWREARLLPQDPGRLAVTLPSCRIHAAKIVCGCPSPPEGSAPASPAIANITFFACPRRPILGSGALPGPSCGLTGLAAGAARRDGWIGDSRFARLPPAVRDALAIGRRISRPATSGACFAARRGRAPSSGTGRKRRRRCRPARGERGPRIPVLPDRSDAPSMGRKA